MKSLIHFEQALKHHERNYIDNTYEKAYVRVKGPDAMTTTTISVTGARAKLYKLIDETVSSHRPVVIKGKRGNRDPAHAHPKLRVLVLVPSQRPRGAPSVRR